MVKAKENIFGAYAFLIGVILAILMGLLQASLNIKESSLPYAILVILGLGVGLSNFNERDSFTFLVSSLSLVIVSGFGQTALVYVANVPLLSSLNAILASLMVMFVPATIVVALKTVFSIATIS